MIANDKIFAFYKKLLSSGVLMAIIFALVIPPVSSLMLGYEFKGQLVTHVPTGILDEDNSTLSRSLVKNIKETEAFDVKIYADTHAEIQSKMNSGEIATAILIPKHFSEDLQSGMAPKVLIMYDGSQMAMTGAVKTRITEIMGTIRAGFVLQIMQAKLSINPAEAQNYIAPIAYTTRLLGNPARSTANYILQGILLSIAQVAVFCLGIEFAVFNSERRKNILDYISNSLLTGFIGTLSVGITLLIQTRVFHNPFNGSFSLAMLMTFVNMVAIANIGIFFAVLFNHKKLWALGTTTLIMATVLLSGFTYPVLALPPFFKAVAKFVPFTYYGLPMRDIQLLGLSFKQVFSNFIWLIQFVMYSWFAVYLVQQIKEIFGLFKSGLANQKGA